MNSRYLEQRLSRYVADKEKNEIFERAFLDIFEHINLSTLAYSEYSNREPKTFYTTRNFFMSHVSKSYEEIDAFVKEVDKDVQYYWKSSLVSLKTYNSQIIRDYKKHLSSVNNPRLKAKLHGKPNLTSLNMITSQADLAILNFPDYQVYYPKDFTHWEVVSKWCFDVINKAFVTHGIVLNLILDEVGEKKESVSKKIAMISNVGSTLFKLGIKLHGAG